MAEFKGESSAQQKAFKEMLSPESLAIFNTVSKKPFSEQCVFFLNAFWNEYKDQAEFIYGVSNRVLRMADMNGKGVQYIHLYDEGNDLDFDMALYFFEQLCMFVYQPEHLKFKPHGLCNWYLTNPNFRTVHFKSLPTMQTSVARKKELRDKVDVNFDGRVSMLEYLLYQYDASPKELMDRSMGSTEEHEEIRKARLALMEVRRRVNAYEAEKHRLTEGSKVPGVKGLADKNQLAQLNCSPLWDAINKALITAEAAVRIATRKFAPGSQANLATPGVGGQPDIMRTDGAVWWLNRELQEQQEKYGPKKK